jgi:single-stranded-DNA-specific exonuclease
MITKGGGHKMAAGLSLTRSQLEPAMARLSDLLARQGSGIGAPQDLRIDSLLTTGAATVALVEEIENAGPFGAAAPAPRFAFANVAVTGRRIGETHLKLTLADGTGPGLDAIAFGAFDGPLGPSLEAPGHRRFHVAGKLELNHWNGRTRVQLRLDDAALA